MVCPLTAGNLPRFTCNNDIKPAYGDGFLNQYLVNSTKDADGNVTQEYDVPNILQMQSVNPDIEFHTSRLKDKPGYYRLTAYFKSKKDTNKH